MNKTTLKCLLLPINQNLPAAKCFTGNTDLLQKHIPLQLHWKNTMKKGNKVFKIFYLWCVQWRCEVPPTPRTQAHSQWPGSPGHNGPAGSVPWSPEAGSKQLLYIQAPPALTESSHELQTSGSPGTEIINQYFQHFSSLIMAQCQKQEGNTVFVTFCECVTPGQDDLHRKTILANKQRNWPYTDQTFSVVVAQCYPQLLLWAQTDHTSFVCHSILESISKILYSLLAKYCTLSTK